MLESLIFSSLASASSAAAVILSAISFLRTRRRDSQKVGEHTGAVMTELGYIKSGIDDIKRRQDKLEARHTAMLERLASVETALRLQQ